MNEYPRLVNVEKATKPCIECGEPALYRVTIELSRDRGDDMVLMSCAEHARSFKLLVVRPIAGRRAAYRVNHSGARKARRATKGGR